jgi:hypothetical protein
VEPRSPVVKDVAVLRSPATECRQRVSPRKWNVADQEVRFGPRRVQHTRLTSVFAVPGAAGADAGAAVGQREATLSSLILEPNIPSFWSGLRGKRVVLQIAG